MLFSLSNVKRRSVRDPDGELAVVPKLAHGRAALKLLEQAIDVFEGYVGKTRGEYDPRALEAVMGDYRLAKCVEACLLTYYAFEQPSFESVLSPEQLAAFAERGLASPTDLRLALWDAANTRHGGFVNPEDRAAVLESLAVEWGLSAEPSLVDTLLSLDSEAMAVLTPTKERPTAVGLASLYNRGVVQTLLAHSTGVRFSLSRLPGAALKRLYFMAKKRGVLAEVEERPGGGFTLSLYGPEQAFGTAEKYGQRLAEVSLSLLRSLLSMGDLSSDEVEATAYLTLHDRPYRFHLNAEILDRLQLPPEPVEGRGGRVAESGVVYSVGGTVEAQVDEGAIEPSFDSLLEAALYKEHKSLEKGGYTHGWGLQREPDPLLAPGIVLIPDFAFLRGDTRVFMEIAGFWSPTYRERKMSKLRTLAAMEGEEAALIIAVPQDAVTIFSGLPYPVIPYKNNLRMTDVLQVLDARYGQREQRVEAASSQLDSLRAAARERGFVPEGEIAKQLQSYTRSELLSSAKALDGEGCKYVAGVGLLSEKALEEVGEALHEALEAAPGGKLPLEEVSRIVGSKLSANVDIEALAQQWADFRIDRPSLFEVYVAVAGSR